MAVVVISLRADVLNGGSIVADFYFVDHDSIFKTDEPMTIEEMSVYMKKNWATMDYRKVQSLYDALVKHRKEIVDFVVEVSTHLMP